MIISGGENIFPLEVENVLRMNEEIVEVSVLGVPDEYWGESVQAEVVLRPDSKLTPEEIRTFVAARSQATRYRKRYMYGMNCRKIPQVILFLPGQMVSRFAKNR